MYLSNLLLHVIWVKRLRCQQFHHSLATVWPASYPSLIVLVPLSLHFDLPFTIFFSKNVTTLIIYSYTAIPLYVAAMLHCPRDSPSPHFTLQPQVFLFSFLLGFSLRHFIKHLVGVLCFYLVFTVNWKKRNYIVIIDDKPSVLCFGYVLTDVRFFFFFTVFF